MELNKVIGKGAQATVYYSEPYAIKVYREGYDKIGVFYEALISSIIEVTKLSVPKIYEVLNIKNQMAIKMDYINGISLFDCILKDEDNTVRYMENMVKLQKEIHSKNITLPSSLKDRLKEKIEANKELSKTQTEEILKLLNELPDGNELCHGDFHGYNILVREEKYWIIDWVDATCGCSDGDACRTYMLYAMHCPELSELYLNLYCRETGKERNKILEWLPVAATARLCETIPNEKEKLMEWIHSALK